MNLSEKLIRLRKSGGMTQEEFAEICDVSRQSVSKWESDMAVPEIDKLLLLGHTFHVTMDVLLNNKLLVDGIISTESYGENAIVKKRAFVYEGILVKESIDDDTILDYINVHKIELWNTGGKPKYWTVLYFTSGKTDFPKIISKVMISGRKDGGNWFVDFKSGNTKFIVFTDKILKYTIGNTVEKSILYDRCRQMGISDDQMNWSE